MSALTRRDLFRRAGQTAAVATLAGPLIQSLVFGSPAGAAGLPQAREIGRAHV